MDLKYHLLDFLSRDCKQKGFLVTDEEYALDIDSDGEEIEEDASDGETEETVKESGFTWEQMQEIAALHNEKGWHWETVQVRFRRLNKRKFYR